MSLISLPPELLLKIFCHLPHSDLQQMRLVSKHWQDLGLTAYLLRESQLVITSDNVQAIKEHLQNTTRAAQPLCLITKVTISVPNNDDNLVVVLWRIGASVRSLHLKGAVKTNYFHHPMPNLEEIYVDAPSVRSEDSNVYPFALNSFGHLKALHIKRPEMMESLLYQLSAASTPVQLQRLTLGRIETSVAALVMTPVLMRHAQTLTHIDFKLTNEQFVWPLSLHALTKLESIKIRGTAHARALTILVDIIPKHAPVKFLSITGLQGISDYCMRIIAHKWWATLEHLELRNCANLTNHSVAMLKVLGLRLKSLTMSYSTIDHLEMTWFGRNETLTVLKLPNISCLKEISVKIFAINLPLLEVLNLENCPEAVTNNSLPYIFGFLGRLRVLVLNECYLISDEGILGLGQWSFPIARLCALEILHLEGLRYVTDRSLITAFIFPQLRDLRLSYCLEVSAAGVEHLVKTCPAIEKLTLSSCIMIGDEAVFHIASGLQRLRELDINNCPNVSKQSVSHIQKHCKLLRQLDTSGIDDLEFGGGRERLSSLSPTIKKTHPQVWCIE